MRRIFVRMDYRYYYETLESAPAAGARGLARIVPAAGLAVVAGVALPALGAVDLHAAASAGVAGALVVALACAVPAALGGGRLLARFRAPHEAPITGRFPSGRDGAAGAS